MDPSLFRIDWEVLAEVLATIIVLSFFIERALALIFEHRLYVEHLKEKGLTEVIAFLASLLVVWRWHFDALAILLQSDTNSRLGYIITAAIIAGGSKASIKLFHDLLKVKSTSLKRWQAAKG